MASPPTLEGRGPSIGVGYSTTDTCHPPHQPYLPHLTSVPRSSDLGVSPKATTSQASPCRAKEYCTRLDRMLPVLLDDVHLAVSRTRRAKRVRDQRRVAAPPVLVRELCGERHLEDHAEFQAGLTRQFVRRLVNDARVMAIRAVARHHGGELDGIGS